MTDVRLVDMYDFREVFCREMCMILKVEVLPGGRWGAQAWASYSLCFWGMNRGASKRRCGYYRALASFHMALSPAKYTITVILSSCLYSLSLPFPTSLSLPQHGNNNAYMTFTSPMCCVNIFSHNKMFNFKPGTASHENLHQRSSSSRQSLRLSSEITADIFLSVIKTRFSKLTSSIFLYGRNTDDTL